MKHVVGEKAVAPSSTLKSGVEEKRGVGLWPLHSEGEKALAPSSTSTLECSVGVKGVVYPHLHSYIESSNLIGQLEEAWQVVYFL